MRDQENFVSGCPDNVFLVINIFPRWPYEPPSRGIWGQCVKLLLEGAVPVFLRVHISTYDFPEGIGTPVPPLDLPMKSHMLNIT